MCARVRGAGRHGALDEARELVSLLTSLSEAGDALAPDAVAERLGVSRERANKLIGLVLTSAAGDGSVLPLVEDGEEVTLLLSDGMRGRSLRLTRSETLALVAALERLGVPGDDPLRARLESSLSALVSEEQARRTLGASDSPVSTQVTACARALAGRRALSFSYRKPGSAPERRLAAPLGLRHEDGTWYLDARDLERGGERTFRLDRMSDMADGGAVAAQGHEADNREARLVRVYFSDPRYLDLLPWHDLEVLSRDDGEAPIVAETPYYGGMWLPRMIAACAGTAHTNDAEVTALVRAYAGQALGGRG